MSDLVAYYRVSTKRQGQSGLGLDAQRAAVAQHVHTTGSALVSEFTEIESGTHSRRPQLAAALIACRQAGAVLVIAKLDRLSRHVAFLATLLDGDVELRALDMPFASRLEFHILSAIAEHEQTAISQRTIAALQVAKARGVQLGTPANLTDASRRASIRSRQAAVVQRHQFTIPLVRAWRRDRWTLQRCATELTRLQMPLPQGGAHWTASQVGRVAAIARRTAPSRNCLPVKEMR